MNIGWIGLGKLGKPCAALMASRFKVYAYDSNPEAINANHKEEGLRQSWVDLIEVCGSVEYVCDLSDIVFVAVQTPHDPMHEGITPYSGESADFDYSHLLAVLKEIADHRRNQQIVIVSTVCPGTFQGVIFPELRGRIPRSEIIYNPFFIAMGTTVWDLTNPEFVLAGIDTTSTDLTNLRSIYEKILANSADVIPMSHLNAEFTKMFYNTAIGLKIMFANTVMEMCDRMGGDCDVVQYALKSADQRIVGRAYMSGGMGDGGACHPRDNLVLSNLCQKLEMDYNIFADMMAARDRQAEYLVNIMREHDPPYWIFGARYKRNTNLTIGSCSMLVKNLMENGEASIFDPDCGYPAGPTEKSTILIGMDGDWFGEQNIPVGSVVIDPWRTTPVSDRYTLYQVGR